MDYTLSNSYVTDAGTGNRMHEDAQAIPTVVSGKDENSVIWSLMEIIKACGLAGIQFDKANAASYRLLLKALRSNGLIRGVDTGVANTMVVGLTPALDARIDGMVLWVKAKFANTGPTTLNDGLGAAPVVGAAHTPLQAGEIAANGACQFVWSATLASYVLVECTGAALQVARSTQSGHAVQRDQGTIGATVRNVNGSRSLGVTYTNSTNRFMWVYISAISSTAGSAALSATVAGVGYIGSSTNGATALSGFISFPVPPGATYQVNAATGSFSAYNNWVEVS